MNTTTDPGAGTDEPSPTAQTGLQKLIDKLNPEHAVHVAALALLAGLTKTKATIDSVIAGSPLAKMMAATVVSTLHIEPEVAAGDQLLADAISMVHEISDATSEASMAGGGPTIGAAAAAHGATAS